MKIPLQLLPPYSMMLNNERVYFDLLTDWLNALIKSDNITHVCRSTGHYMLPYWRLFNIPVTRNEEVTPEEIKEMEFLINQKLTLEDRDDRRVILDAGRHATVAMVAFQYVDIKRLGGRTGLLNI